MMWPPEQRQLFLASQFRAQDAHHREHFRTASFDLILLGGEPIGRLYVDRRSDEHHLIDIALLPEHRGRGIGGSLLADLLAEGERLGLPILLHVEHSNPAGRLYRRLGFELVEDREVFQLMRWTPASTPES